MIVRSLPKALLALFLTYAPLAGAAEPPKLDAANTAWMITASVLVLFMTLPGLALFYAGLVRAKNVLSRADAVLRHHLRGDARLGGRGLQPRLRRRRRAQRLVRRLRQDASSPASTSRRVKGSIPETVFAMFQMTFAIITPALVIGAYAERVKFSRHAAVQPAVAAPRLLPGRALGVGRRLAAEDGRAWISPAAWSCT